MISDCCSNLGIDVNPVLGPHAANCGTINSAPHTTAARDRNRKALACVRSARTGARAFVVNQGYSIFPDYALQNVVIFGAQGEKVLVRIEQAHDGATYSMSSCTVLNIRDNGELEFAGCQEDEALNERMKPTGVNDSKR